MNRLPTAYRDMEGSINLQEKNWAGRRKAEIRKKKTRKEMEGEMSMKGKEERRNKKKR